MLMKMEIVNGYLNLERYATNILFQEIYFKQEFVIELQNSLCKLSLKQKQVEVLPDY